MDFIRTTTLGQVLHHASGRRWLRNADESDVSILATYVDREASKKLARWGSISSRHDLPYTDGTSSFYEEPRINIASGAIIHEKHGKDIFLVKFTEQDSEVGARGRDKIIVADLYRILGIGPLARGPS